MVCSFLKVENFTAWGQNIEFGQNKHKMQDFEHFCPGKHRNLVQQEYKSQILMAWTLNGLMKTVRAIRVELCPNLIEWTARNVWDIQGVEAIAVLAIIVPMV